MLDTMILFLKSINNKITILLSQTGIDNYVPYIVNMYKLIVNKITILLSQTGIINYFYEIMFVITLTYLFYKKVCFILKKIQKKKVKLQLNIEEIRLIHDNLEEIRKNTLLTQQIVINNKNMENRLETVEANIKLEVEMLLKLTKNLEVVVDDFEKLSKTNGKDRGVIESTRSLIIMLRNSTNHKK
jgi:hypothetical protein